ncbi:AfsR/SARP family transcriptional regulator [Micromonospora sp. WMMD882]|uniref:AfsR/SARP family transcriptional regulator n=1 Tax=Micromonospora sp. WMMD882 TaxID=3015151 RepID=UPI00248CC786|nr:AfsR/SARP family transcriptional regulator [Micromonospora sp. WMMD882]WBB80074.1 AfsR/SARP family transcriptional regulator [Micromonospora sp. WMMD882]
MASINGQNVPLGGRQPKTILSRLLLANGLVVGDDTIVDAVWGARPPRSARQALHTYVRHLRRALEPDREPRGASAVLVRHPGGYAVDPTRVELDADRFADLVATGSAALLDGRCDVALTRLDAALGLWHGAPYADLGAASVVQGAVRQLELLRATAREDRIAARLALGQHHRVLVEAQSLTDEHPLHERAWELRGLALYRCGRPAEALGALRAAQRWLRDELGVDPGHRLQALRQAILKRDRALDWQPVTALRAYPAPWAVN